MDWSELWCLFQKFLCEYNFCVGPRSKSTGESESELYFPWGWGVHDPIMAILEGIKGEEHVKTSDCAPGVLVLPSRIMVTVMPHVI